MYQSKLDNNLIFWLLISIISISLSNFTIIWQLHKGMYWPYNYVCDSNQIFPILVAVSTFMLFKNFKIPYSKIINKIGATTFGVLLIHANSDYMRSWLWQDVISVCNHIDLNWYPIIVCYCIFTVCLLIELIRINTIEKYLLCVINLAIKKNKKR